MNQKLTDQQKSIYLDQHPEQCPFCRSEDIGILETFDGQNAISLKQSRACNDCKRSWIDHYTLTSLEEIEEPGVITITVKGGCVQEVKNLPEGWVYEVEDLDNAFDNTQTK